MKKILPYSGIFLIIIGTILLVLTRISSLSTSNVFLMAGLGCIIVGIIAHIAAIKRESRY